LAAALVSRAAVELGTKVLIIKGPALKATTSPLSRIG
jgi:hypothetical protein